MTKVLKTYEDGSEMTIGLVAVATVAAAVGGVALFAAQQKFDTWKTKRTMKKYGWPQDAIDRM